MYDKVAYLGVVGEDQDYMDADYSNKIYCKEKSVGSSQFYQAQAIGMKLDIILCTRKCNYSGQMYIKYKDIHYDVKRSFVNPKGEVELVLESI